MELSAVAIEKPDDLNVIIGQAHFIKTVEDLHEALVGISPHLRFGIAFCDVLAVPDPSLGKRRDLIELATRNAVAIGAGHSFVVFIDDGYPVNVLAACRQVPEVCNIFCATANPVQVLVAETELGRGVLGVVDGLPPAGVETDDDIIERKRLLRAIGYKL